MGVIIDITGHKYGRLSVISFIERKKLHNYYKCKCDCGTFIIAIANNLRRGTTQSCGCLQKERVGNSNSTHKMSGNNSEYKTWKGIKERCYNPKNNRYADWGGRGIEVCERWINSYVNFITDMGFKPTKNHSIDRINVNGNYEPSNCRWATIDEQSRGRRDNVWIEYKGERLIRIDWAKRFGVTGSTLSEHLEKKSFEEVYEYYKNKKPLLNL